MAEDTLTTIQYGLLRQENRLVDLTTKFFKDPLAGLLRDGNKITTLKQGGRTLTRYFNDTLFPAGGFGVVGQGGDYPTAQPESQTQASIAMQLFAMTVGFEEHALTAMEVGGRDIVMQGVKSKLKASVEHTQRRIGRLVLGRGDGIVGRASAAGSSSTSFTSSIPLLCVPGDIVYANPGAGAGDERDLGGSDSISGIQVTDVNYMTNTLTLASAQTWADDDVLYLTGAANNEAGAGVYLHGIEAMCDNVSDNFQYDADDDSTYDHVDTYLGLTRSSVTQANVTEYNASSTSPTISMFGAIYNSIAYKGADPNNLFVLIHPTTYQAYSDTLIGTAPRSVMTKLPGGSYSLPIIDGIGQGQIRCIVDPGIPTDKIIMLDASKYYKLTAPGGWNKRSGNLWKQEMGTNAPNSTYTALFDIWLQVALNLPFTSCVAYDVTTT